MRTVTIVKSDLRSNFVTIRFTAVSATALLGDANVTERTITRAELANIISRATKLGITATIA